MKYLFNFDNFLNEELGPKFAAASLDPITSNDERTKRLKKDAITSLFSDYIGKDLPFFIKTTESNEAIKFKLIEVLYNSMQNVLKLFFYNENGVDNDAPFHNNKREIILEYSLKEDKYLFNGMTYLYNQYTINFLIKAANLIRQTYYTIFPLYKDSEINRAMSEIDIEGTENAKISKLKKQSFRIFSYDSKNMLNK